MVAMTAVNRSPRASLCCARAGPAATCAPVSHSQVIGSRPTAIRTVNERGHPGSHRTERAYMRHDLQQLRAALICWLGLGPVWWGAGPGEEWENEGLWRR